MTYEEYLKQNPDFAKKIEIKENMAGKSYSSVTVLKFLFIAITTGLLAMILGGATSMAFAAHKITLIETIIKSAGVLIFSIFSIAYIIAIGVYIGTNSK